jgi:hypothetical protein
MIVFLFEKSFDISDGLHVQKGALQATSITAQRLTGFSLLYKPFDVFQ